MFIYVLMFARIPKRTFFTVIDSNVNAVRLRFGKVSKIMEPGFHFYIPLVDEINPIYMSERVDKLPFQTLISRDNVSVSLDSSIQYQVTDPYKALFAVKNFKETVMERTSMSIREAVSTRDINSLLHNSNEVRSDIIETIGDTKHWGVKVIDVNIKDIIFDESMKKSMATKAEADRMAQAKIINAQADIETAKMFKEAAAIYDDEKALKLREFQLLSSISKNPASTIYFYPTDIAKIFKH